MWVYKLFFTFFLNLKKLVFFTFLWIVSQPSEIFYKWWHVIYHLIAWKKSRLKPWEEIYHQVHFQSTSYCTFAFPFWKQLYSFKSSKGKDKLHSGSFKKSSRDTKIEGLCIWRDFTLICCLLYNFCVLYYLEVSLTFSELNKEIKHIRFELM